MWGRSCQMSDIKIDRSHGHQGVGCQGIASWLTQWGRVTHLCVSKLTSIASDNGLSPGWRQAIIWANAVILSIGPLGTNFSEILIKIITFSYKKMSSKVSSGKRRPSCLGLNVLTHRGRVRHICVNKLWQLWLSVRRQTVIMLIGSEQTSVKYQ